MALRVSLHCTRVTNLKCKKMSKENLPNIPIPMRQHLRDARMRLAPVVIFLVAAIMISLLWKDYVAAPMMLGQAEPLQANVSSYKAGMLAELNVTRFQKVRAGEVVGQVLVTDPKILSASLAVIQADIEVLRTGMTPVANQQRVAMNYDSLRLDWMANRSKLAIARVNLQASESEFHRMEELYKEKIVSQRMFEQAQAAFQRNQSEVKELTVLVDDQENNFKQLGTTNSPAVSIVTEDPLRAAIAAQESKLRLTEAELSPVALKAPVDGMVAIINHRAGEAITAGESVVVIAVSDPVRIIGYMRPPILSEPKVGMRVDVRTRGPHRQVGTASVVDVGVQLENVAPALLPTFKPTGVELGLPIAVSVPATMKIRSGELVDLTLVPASN